MQDFPELSSVESISVSVCGQRQPKSKPSNPLYHDLKSPTESHAILRPKNLQKKIQIVMR
jgi:hypothetical protein